mmetsp:Transcript_13439/g.21987  ORF Transcript_13439/g.21987 Transcript_13439/m.21987 type:complete len:365 (-) Transcript_13439:60-1154(-)
MGIVVQTCVFDPPYHRCCYPCGKCCDSICAAVCCYKKESLPYLPETNGEYSKVLERLTARGSTFHIWEGQPVKYVKRWSQGKPYYTDLSDDHSTWARPKGFGMSPKNAKFHIIYSHGRREDITMFSPRWRLQKLAWSLDSVCYMYEWPGYAKSSGLPSQRRVYESIRATYDYIVKEKKIDPSRVILYGMSLGTAPTAWLASQVPVGGIILQSGFTSICRVVSSHCGCRGLCACCLPGCSHCCDVFDTYDLANDVKCPVYILHSKSDEVIPFEHAEDLLEAFRGKIYKPPYIVDDVKHDFFPVQTREYVENLKGFLDFVAEKCQSGFNDDQKASAVTHIPSRTEVADSESSETSCEVSTKRNKTD